MPQRQRGFAGVLLLVILVSSLLLAAFSYMGRQSKGGISDASAKLNASILVRQGSALAEAMEDVRLSRGVSIAALTFDQDPATGVFAARPGARVPTVPQAPIEALVPGSGAADITFSYSTQVALPGVGSLAGDAVVFLPRVAKPVCQQINAVLYGDTASSEPAVSTAAVGAWAGGSVDDTGLGAGYVGRSEGCVGSSDGFFIYYRVIAHY